MFTFLGAAWRDKSPGKLIQRTIVGLIIIAFAGGIGYLLAPSSDTAESSQTTARMLPVRSVAYVQEINPTHIKDVKQTDELIRRELHRQVSAPRIADVQLTGIAIEEVVSGARVPVFLYEGENERIVVYAYNYALVDEHYAQLQLTRDTFRRLENEFRFVTTEFENHHVILWRHRDDIFAAVTRGNPDSLIQRIQHR